jgi:hypothetical protein
MTRHQHDVQQPRNGLTYRQISGAESIIVLTILQLEQHLPHREYIVKAICSSTAIIIDDPTCVNDGAACL